MFQMNWGNAAKKVSMLHMPEELHRMVRTVCEANGISALLYINRAIAAAVSKDFADLHAKGIVTREDDFDAFLMRDWLSDMAPHFFKKDGE